MIGLQYTDPARDGYRFMVTHEYRVQHSECLSVCDRLTFV